MIALALALAMVGAKPASPTPAPRVPRFRAVESVAPTIEMAESRGVAWNDLEGDGKPELIVASMGVKGGVRIFRQAAGVWQAVDAPALERRVDAEGIVALDVTGDRQPDLIVARTDGPPMLWINRGGNFEHDAEAFAEVASPSSMVCLADFDRDGDLDAAVVTRGANADLIFANDGGRFMPAAGALEASARDGRACAVGDPNGDGLPDLFVGNFVAGGENLPDDLFINRGAFRFLHSSTASLGAPPSRTYGAAFVDWDQDGDDDLAVNSIGRGDRNRLFENRNGSLVMATDFTPSNGATGPTKGQVWGDYDNDGDIDLFLSEGTEGLTAEHRPFDNKDILYVNEGGRLSGAATGVLVEETAISAGAARSDFDRDGDLDLYVANWGGGGQSNALYENLEGGRFIALILEGAAGNAQGIGARVTLELDRHGQIVRRSASLWPQSGYASMNEPLVHFGLGPVDRPRRIEIRWPDGKVDRRNIDGTGYFQAVRGGALTRSDQDDGG